MNPTAKANETPSRNLRASASSRSHESRMQKAVEKAANGCFDDLHELLRHEDSPLGRAYRELADLDDCLDHRRLEHAQTLMNIGKAMNELRGLVIQSELVRSQ